MKIQDLGFKIHEERQRRGLLSLFLNRESIFVNVQRKTRAAPGFTLIEMLVAVAIFMFVMVIAVGSLIAIVAADRKAQSIAAVVDNLRFALDDMSRTVRTGTNYDASTGCSGVANGTDCTSGSSQISVTDQYARQVTYRFSTRDQCNGGVSTGPYIGGCLMRFNPSLGDATFLPISSSEIIIDTMRFYVRGSRSEGQQPELVMTMSGHVSVGLKQPTIVHLQTTVTQRSYDS